MESRRLVDDGSDTFCFHDAPDEEGNTRDGSHDGLDGEKVATGRVHDVSKYDLE